MSGLILAGIGKGIADAGQTMGSFILKDIEAKRQAELEAIRDERTIAREEARETRATSRTEAAALKDAKIYSDAEQSAVGVGATRRFEKFKKDVGQTDATDEELRKAFDEHYDQRKVGNLEGSDRYIERYSKQKEDVLSEIRRMGGSSGLINQAMTEAKGAREAERAADAQAFSERKLEEQEARRRDEFKSLLPIKQQQADASTARANRAPATGGSGSSADKPATTADLQRQVDNAATGILEKVGGKKADLFDTLTRLEKRAAQGDAKAQQKLDDAAPLRNQWRSASERLQNFKLPANAQSASTAGDNPKSARTISVLPKDATRIGTSGGKPVYQTPDGKKFIGN